MSDLIKFANSLKACRTNNAWGMKAGTIYMAFSYTLTALFIFGFQMIAVRLLKPEQYGIVSILYSSIVFISMFVGQTFELTLSKFVSEYETNGRNYFSLIKRVYLFQFSSLAVYIILFLLLKDFIIRDLFPEAPQYFYLLLACGAFYSIEIGLKGVMRGLRGFGIFGTLTYSLNLLRIIYLLLFVGILNLGLLGAGVSILLASITNLALILLWYRRVWNKITGDPSRDEAQISNRQLGKFIIPTMAMFGASTYFYNTGPIFIKLFGGEAANELAGLFLIAVMISRLPLQLSEALSTNLLPNMSRHVAHGDWRSIRFYIQKSYQIFVPLSIVAVLGIYFVGPFAIRVIYPEFFYDRFGLTLLMLGIGVIMLVAPLIQFLLARQKVAIVVIGWLTACIGLTLVVFFASGSILNRLEIGYLVGAIAIWLCLGAYSYREMNEMKSKEISLLKEISI